MGSVSGQQPDLVILGSVVTMSRIQPFAEAVAVRDGRVLAVGRRDEVLGLAGVGTKIIDCRGEVVVPGFIDAHCHIMASAAARVSVDCSPSAVGSIGDIQQRLKEAVNRVPAGSWIRGVGYNEFYLMERRHPTRHDIDQVVSSNPVRLIHRSGHAFVLNSLAMSLLGIDACTEDPPGGIIERDPLTGEPLGLFLGAVDYWDRRFPTMDEQQLGEGVKIFGAELLASGITSVADLTSTNSLDDWRILQSFRRLGYLKSHVCMMLSPSEATDDCFSSSESEDVGNVRINGVKVVLEKFDEGSLSSQLDLLRHRLALLHRAGYQIAIHAVEGKPLIQAIGLMRGIIMEFPRRVHRHRIEHCAICPQELRRQIKELGLVIVSQPGFVYQNGERYLLTVADDDMPSLYPFASLVKEGIVIAAGSDSPVGKIDPLLGIYAAVTRKAENDQIVGIDQAVEPEVAMAMYTRNAAYACFIEAYSGTIEPGKRADLVVLSDNPLSCYPENIKDIRVEMTLINGQIVFRR